MKHIFPVIFMLTLILASPQSHAESKPAESQGAANNSDSKISSSRIFANALLLADIYRKIQKISGNEDRDVLNPILNQLNAALDEVIIFKNSFTPQKKQKIEIQLTKIKGQIQLLTETQSKDFKSSSLQLTSALLDLVDILLDRSQGNKM